MRMFCTVDFDITIMISQAIVAFSALPTIWKSRGNRLPIRNPPPSAAQRRTREGRRLKTPFCTPDIDLFPLCERCCVSRRLGVRKMYCTCVRAMVARRGCRLHARESSGTGVCTDVEHQLYCVHPFDLRFWLIFEEILSLVASSYVYTGFHELRMLSTVTGHARQRRLKGSFDMAGIGLRML
ncbi:hypothetical protein ABW21_db0207256 [Orbilia brochopaga]|nr:hypothetical protein ABW21_db0207256 [Drechslerella brochopaga]